MVQNEEEPIVNFEGKHFFGTLLAGKAIETFSKQRSKPYTQRKIKKEDEQIYLDTGWNLIKELKNEIIIRKNKEVLDYLIDETWTLFKNMEFTQMNENSDFAVLVETYKKKIDVFARDKHNVFIVFCETEEEKLKERVSDVSKIHDNIVKAIREQYVEKLRVTFLIVTKGLANLEKYDNIFTTRNIFLWDEATFNSFKFITEQIGHSAKYQMFATLFSDKPSSEVGEIEVPAIYGGVGKHKHYCFVIHPEKLFPIVYVHRREKTILKAKNIKTTYQRMVSKTRINDIAKFINQGQSFPNNLIISFNKEHKPKFEQKDKVGDISFGILKFPPYYGCAWIIDGQHRLYGYSKSNKSSDHTIPVIAFVSQEIKDQANLFVDINQKQQSVSKNLLWDLYPDIYEGSEDKSHQLLRAISLTAKRLNQEPNSFFFNRIQIPSKITKDKKETNLTLTNICEAISENKLLEEAEGLLFNKSYDETVNYATKIINSYFEVISEFLPEDWNKGNNGLLRTNVGLRIFFSIFRQLLRYLVYQQEDRLYHKTDLIEFKEKTKKILEDVKIRLRAKTKDEINQIRKASTKGQVLTNTQKLLWYLKEDIQLGVELWYGGKAWSPDIPEEADDQKIRDLLEKTETELRRLIIKELKGGHGDKWFNMGIVVMNDVKDYIGMAITAQSEKEKWRKEEFDNLTPERKIEGFIDTTHLRKIINYNPNWKFFEKVFIKDKEYTMAQFKSFEFIRIKYQHFAEHECDEISKNLGYWGMRWIRRCMGIDTPEKKEILNF